MTAAFPVDRARLLNGARWSGRWQQKRL